MNLTQFTGQAKTLAVHCKIPPLESYKIFHLLTLSAPSSLLLLLMLPHGWEVFSQSV